MEDTVNPLTADFRSQQQDLWDHSDKLGDLEDRMQRNNLRFIGFPEGGEGKNPEDFLENWFKLIVETDHLSSLFAIERAQMVPMCPLPRGHVTSQNSSLMEIESPYSLISQ